MISGKNKTILLVEDEVILAMTQKMSLEKYGYNVIIVNSGEKAVEIINNTPGIQLILMDIDLGKGIDGTKAAEIILKDHDIPVIFCSSHTEPEIVEKTEKITSYGYVVKSSSITVLDASIKMAFKLFDEKTERIRTEMVLLETQTILQAAMDQSDAGIAIANAPDGKLRYVNDSGLLIRGGTRESVVNGIGIDSYVNTWKLLDLDGKPLKEDEVPLARAITFGETCSREFIIRREVDDDRTVLAKASPIKNSDGIVTSAIVVFMDITESKLAEEILRESEEKHRTLISSMKDSVMVHRINQDGGLGNFIEVNEAACASMGYTREEFLNLTPLDIDAQEQLVDGEIIERDKILATFLKNGFAVFNQVHKAKDGTYLPVEVSSTLFTFKGAPHIISIAKDRTEEKNTERKLLKALQLLQAIIESPVGIIIMSIDKNYQYLCFNSTHSTSMKLSYDKDIATGMNILECISSDKDREKAKANYDRAMAGESHSTIEVYGDTKKFYYESFYNPIYDENKEIIGITAYAMNITERKQAESKITALLAEKELILKEVNHRIKNNMNSMKGLLLLQAKTMNEAATTTALEDASKRMQSMEILYDQLYQSASFTELSIKSYLSSLIDAVIVNFPEGILVKVEKHIEDFILDAKRLQLLGIIINELITNIMKYAFTDKSIGIITVNATLVEAHIILYVQDNGKGFPPSINFENSTGFGLMLVNALAGQLDGKIQIERVGGTRIVLEFER